ncbi:MAG: sortase [Chloroflexi bacterium]|nr:sortase [Chloroflexota bacterium]
MVRRYYSLVMASVQTVRSSYPQRRFPRWALGLALVLLGALIVGVAGSYYAYSRIASGDLDSLVYNTNQEYPSLLLPGSMTLEGLRRDTTSLAKPTGLPDPAGYRLYPGERIPFNFWAEPWAAESGPYPGEELPQGFLPIDAVSGFVLGELGTLPRADRITIPSIELEAEVQDLGILDLGDSLQYETPDQVVGHIPVTANPGEIGNNWLFGHLQSPIRGEGAVFRDLPLIPDILKTGRRVYVTLDAPNGTYLYEVYKTNVVYQDDLTLYSTNDASLTLVTCVPQLVYDHRLLVSATLIGFKPAA